jgi:hypothetical protein
MKVKPGAELSVPRMVVLALEPAALDKTGAF